VEVLRLYRESDLLKVGRLSLDGTKIKANASRRKAMSYDRMLAEEKRLQANINELFRQAKANNVRQVEPMLDLTITNIDQAGVTENITAFTADAGYFSESVTLPFLMSNCMFHADIATS